MGWIVLHHSQALRLAFQDHDPANLHLHRLHRRRLEEIRHLATTMAILRIVLALEVFLPTGYPESPTEALGVRRLDRDLRLAYQELCAALQEGESVRLLELEEGHRLLRLHRRLHHRFLGPSSPLARRRAFYSKRPD